MVRKFRDDKFRKVVGHRLVKNLPRPVTIYLYESPTKIYDIVVGDDGYQQCRTQSKVSEPSQYHREIDKFFNLGLLL